MSMKWASVIVIAFVGAVALSPPVAAEKPGFVFPGICCYYNGEIVRTVVPPSAFPFQGRDNFYGFAPGAASGQLGVVGVAPGAEGYHGGQWAVYVVTWGVDATPSVLTSEAAILDAEDAGWVTITRMPAMDFLCPIQF